MDRERKAVELFCRSHAMEPALFSVRQVSEAVGLSRTMLVELEQKGFLTPARVNPKTGYRYYDAFNVSKIEQYQTLRTMGLTQQDVFAYFESPPDKLQDILAKMKRRLAILQNGIDALSLRQRRDNNFRLSEIELSDVTCYCKTVISRGPEEGERFAYRTYEETIARGFRLLPTEPMFLLRLEFAKDRADGKYLTKMCIPIDPVYSEGRNADGVEIIYGGKALSVLCCGDYKNNTLPNQGFAFLLSEIERRGLTVAGAMRQISIVVPGVNKYRWRSSPPLEQQLESKLKAAFAMGPQAAVSHKIACRYQIVIIKKKKSESAGKQGTFGRLGILPFDKIFCILSL